MVLGCFEVWSDGRERGPCPGDTVGTGVSHSIPGAPAAALLPCAFPGFAAALCPEMFCLCPHRILNWNSVF